MLNALSLPPNLSIRPMTQADIADIHHLDQQVFPSPWQSQFYEQQLQHNQHAHFHVLHLHKNLIGYSACWLIVDEMHIGGVAVLPLRQKLGFGQVLLADILHRSQGLEAEVATLEVRPSNISARNLYKKFGFADVGLRPRYYGNGEDAIIMTTPPLASSSYQHIYQAQCQQLETRLSVLNLDEMPRLT